eukprot:5270123-Pleurochrysis_carterae.AAC.1
MEATRQAVRILHHCCDDHQVRELSRVKVGRRVQHRRCPWRLGVTMRLRVACGRVPPPARL